uniref:Cullin-associated NEDD8-dissociated protein 1-like n=1 Tax=Pundamilia nyererei TaxID=303518 RepID=A0A3B4FNB5_9CICH
MSSVSYHISNLLEKMTSTDKDFRMLEIFVILFCLKNLLIHCKISLEIKVKEPQVETMVDVLCSNMTSDKEQLRDISSMGLKTVIAELPLTSSGLTLTGSVCKKITSQLIGAMGKHDDVSVQLEALDILSDMLGSPRMAVRKRSILALGHLVPCCSPALFSQLTEHLMKELAKGPPTSMTRTYIQCLATISRQGGHRVGEHLEKLIPMVVKFTGVEDDELREYCFQAFEAFIRRCPKEMSPHIATVTQLCLKYMTFDPNYNYDDNEEEDEDRMDIDDELEEESDDEYSDDDDMSWKVRRSSIKCLEALISTRLDLLLSFYSSICPALLARFKEREENVRADVFTAFSTLLRQTRVASSRHSLIVSGSDPGVRREEEPAVALLKKQVPATVKALHRQLKEKSIKSRQGCFCLLTELAHTVPGALEEHIPALIPGIIFSLTDKSTLSTMRIDALSFFNVLLLSHPPQAFQPHMQVLLPPVIACIEDTFYKITSEALLVIQHLVKVMRPQGQAGGFDPKPFVKEVFSVTMKRLKATDIDQEVKERAISCMGHIVCHLGDHLRAEVQAVLAIFLERLKNEITRLTAVRTITLIAASPLKIDMSPILPEALSVLGSFLRKNQRALKLGTLACLTALVTHHAASIKPAALEPVLSELPTLVDESDMHVSQVSITLLTGMAKAYPSTLAKISSSVLPGVFRLIHSPLLQGSTLEAILEYLQALVLSKTSNLSYRSQSSADGSIVHRQSYHSVARCVAALSSASPKETPGTVKNPGSPEAARVLALLCLGEVGRKGSLGGSKEVQGVILEAFSSTSEEVKTAASCALGSMAVGCLSDYLPFLLKEISAQPRRQYLLLHSLKEVIRSSSLSPHVESVWALLFQNCECQEEGTRNLVAECLGKLTLVNPAALLPRLKQQLKTGSPLARSTVVTAIKFTIVDHPAPIDSLLKDCIGDFLKTLQDEDINVRRIALVMFNSAAHNKPSLIRGLLGRVLPHLYKETQIRKDLIREVEMGPFKHTVDDGLDVRKAAFECMYSLLDSCLEGLDILQFLDHVEEGLKDHYDIRMLTFLMLARLVSLCPAAVLQRLDRLVEPLKATVTTKVKAGSVKQEFEKQEELRRSAMRAVAALLAVPEVERSPSMAEFANQIKTSTDMASIYQSIKGGEGGGIGATESMDMS